MRRIKSVQWANRRRYTTLILSIPKERALLSVKSANLGTIYELQYRLRLKQDRVPKELMDGIRCRNGNLNVSCGRMNDKEML